MRRAARIALILLAASLLFESSAVYGDDKAAEFAAVLDRARTLENLRGEGGVPFVLRANLKFTYPKGSADGFYALTWLAKDRWHEQMRLGDYYARVRDGVRGGYQQVRAPDYDAGAIEDLGRALRIPDLLKIAANESLGKLSTRKASGERLSCVEIRVEKAVGRDLCFDPAGLLVHATIYDSARGDEQIDYADAATLGGKSFPRYIKSQRPGGFAIEAKVTDFGGASAEAMALPAPDPARAEFWRTCDDPTPSKLLNRAALPVYPLAAKERHEQGLVMISVRVEVDGSLSHLIVLGSPSPELSKAAVDAVSQWKYSPTLCDGDPIRVETTIDVVFQMG